MELAVALYNFEPQRSSDLGFQEGDVLQIVKRSDRKNWWKAKRVVDRNGREDSDAEDEVGDVPKTYIKVFDPSAVVVAYHQWVAQDDTEIGFTTGTVILVHEKHSTGWWQGRTIADPKIGVFPGTYVREFTTLPAVAAAKSASSDDGANRQQAGTKAKSTEAVEPEPALESGPAADLLDINAKTRDAVNGANQTVFALDDFDAFDILMAEGWCFNPDFELHSPAGDGAVAVPGQKVFVHLTLFLWDGTTGALKRLVSSCEDPESPPISFRVAHGSWLGEDWIQGSGGDETKKWAGGSKQLAAVHLAVQQMGVGGVGEIVAAPGKAYGELEPVICNNPVPRNSQVRAVLAVA